MRRAFPHDRKAEVAGSDSGRGKSPAIVRYGGDRMGSLHAEPDDDFPGFGMPRCVEGCLLADAQQGLGEFRGKVREVALGFHAMGDISAGQNLAQGTLQGTGQVFSLGGGMPQVPDHLTGLRPVMAQHVAGDLDGVVRCLSTIRGKRLACRIQLPGDRGKSGQQRVMPFPPNAVSFLGDQRKPGPHQGDPPAVCGPQERRECHQADGIEPSSLKPAGRLGDGECGRVSPQGAALPGGEFHAMLTGGQGIQTEGALGTQRNPLVLEAGDTVTKLGEFGAIQPVGAERDLVQSVRRTDILEEHPWRIRQPQEFGANLHKTGNRTEPQVAVGVTPRRGIADILELNRAKPVLLEETQWMKRPAGPVNEFFQLGERNGEQPGGRAKPEALKTVFENRIDRKRRKSVALIKHTNLVALHQGNAVGTGGRPDAAVRILGEGDDGLVRELLYLSSRVARCAIRRTAPAPTEPSG